ncbi:MAG TPA: enolase C-terminal domain-like protein [Thermoleophilaceae bacterium]|jgi:L-alanine-DL-glutamate epimerase-like enolase superfamily enzyme|nr:enolase C-terminal domain-like protein [Thermoleophilaceae bacterium]
MRVQTFEIPTDEPESDGTLAWDATTVVVVEVEADGRVGLGYTYADASAAQLIESKLAPLVDEHDPMAPPATWMRMRAALRNVGQQGLGAMAISAVDIALWDLKAKLLGVPLADALPRFHAAVPIYGSGGFTSYSLDRLQEQLRGWVGQGIGRVKIKVGRDPGADPERLDAAREAIGPDVELMVDANGAFDRVQALAWAQRYREQWNVTWFEEPVSSQDLEGMAFVRDHSPPGVAIAAGEYAWDLADLARMARCVDVLQADVTRCGGVSAFIRADGIARAHGIPLSAHCAPAASMHACCACESLAHLEYFHDHVRVERMLFDGVAPPHAGALHPPDAPGLGLTLARVERQAA